MNIGWIGTGVMGASMAGHLQAAGHALYIHNRSRAKAQALLDGGATWCDHPCQVAATCEAVCTIVGYPADVEQVYFGDRGILGNEAACRLAIDFTTSRPALARTIHDRAKRYGIATLDAPVSGGDAGARNATLAIMVGGDVDAFEQAQPLFALLGKTVARMGGPGAGQHAKMCNQILIAGTMIGVVESLLYAERLGLDPQAVIDIVGKGAAASWAINNLGPRMVKGDFAPGFYVEHFVKDMGIALEEAGAANLSLPGLALVHQLYTAVKAQGRGRLGTQALLLALRQLNRQ